MTMSEEELNEYLTRQQMEQSEYEQTATGTSAYRSPLARPSAAAKLALSILLLSFFVAVFLLRPNRSLDEASDGAARDNILSWAAWFGGAEFDPKTHPFSSQYEFEIPETKPIDWDEYVDRNQEMVESHQEQFSR